MRIGINDIMDIDKKGRWWLVGSAWAGNDDSQTVQLSNMDGDKQIMQLAKSQKMNTDVRKSIFVILMSSEVLFINLIVFRTLLMPTSDY